MEVFLDKKILDFEALLSSSTDKQELSGAIQELSSEIDQEVTNMAEILEKLPNTIKQIQATVLAMREGTNP